MKKRFVQKIVVFSLVLAMQAAPLSYAADEGTGGQPGENVTITEDDGTEGNEPGGTGNTDGSQNPQTPDSSLEEEPGSSGGMGNGGETGSADDSGNIGEPGNIGESGNTEESGTEEPTTPEAPADQGNPGWYRLGNDWYYYDASGAKAYGWRLIGGSWYYLDQNNTEKPGVMLSSGRYMIGGTTYFFDASGAMRTGWIREPEGWYYANGSGAVVTGWMALGNTWYYLDGANEKYPGLMLENEKKVIGTATYFFAPGGAMRTGWIQQEEGWYYSDTTSSTGWKYVNGAWYYLDGANETHPGLMVANEKKVIGNATYFFDGNGAMRTGWIDTEEGWYYSDTTSSTGWKYVNGAWYYLDGANEKYPGLMVADCEMDIGGAIYSFSVSGAMYTGWVQKPEGWYYYNGSGVKVTGWVLGAAWYYLDGANTEHPGLMVTDCKMNIGGTNYFFQPSGAMITGWALRPEGWYYANGSGAMITGWIQYGGKWYYLNPANEENPGLMVSDCTMTIGGQTYVFKADGAMRAGWEKDADGGWYYYDTYTGQIKSGWQYIGGAWYYLDPNNGNRMLEEGWHEIGGGWYYMYGSGAMATNWLNLGGKWYYLGGDGAMKTGWQYVGNFWYYMYTQNDPHGGEWGVMASNTTIDGYFLQPNGAMMSAEQYNMYLRAQMYGSSTGYLILVDRAACRVGVFSGRAGAWNMVYFWACAPGTAATPTVGGEFTVQGKGYYFDSGSSRCYWYTQFYGNYLFHSVLYSKYTGGLVDGRVGIPLSHGCVRLEINNAKWIYDNIPRGTKVVIY